jgi:hypothetical protein
MLSTGVQEEEVEVAFFLKKNTIDNVLNKTVGISVANVKSSFILTSGPSVRN